MKFKPTQAFITVLTGECAERFIKAAEKAEYGPKTDFSAENERYQRILTKSKFILRDDEDVSKSQVKGYKYILP